MGTQSLAPLAHISGTTLRWILIYESGRGLYDPGFVDAGVCDLWRRCGAYGEETYDHVPRSYFEEMKQMA